MAKLARDYVSDNNRIVSHLDRQNLSHLYKDKKYKTYLLQLRDEFNEKFPGEPKGSAEFHSLIRHLQSHLKEDMFDFFKFLTDARRIQPIFRDIINFHNLGPTALPDHMLHAGQFSWSEDHAIELNLVVRGIGKSVFLVAEAIHDLIIDPYGKSLFIQDKQDQSTRSIGLIKNLIVHPVLALVFPHLFKASVEEYRQEGGIFRRQEVDLKPSSIIYSDVDTTNPAMFRKESSYAASSPQTNEVGVHVSNIYYDDLVNINTPKTQAESDSQIEFFQALDALEEYDVENNRGLRYKGAGTMWRGPGLYKHIMEDMNSSVFSLPIEYKYKETQYYIAPIFDAEKVAEKVKALGTWSDSQLYMREREWETESVDLGFSEEHHVIRLAEREVETFKKLGVVAQSCDPAYSEKGKKDGDSKSRFTILHTIMTADTMYLFDVYSSKGERTDPTLKLNREGAKRHGTDVFVMDAQGTQESLFKDVRDELYREYDSTITTIPYKKGSNFKGLTGKAEIANGVLRSIIAEGKLKVLITDENESRMRLVIDQLSGKDGGFDVIDCVVMTKVSVNVVEEMNTARSRRNRGQGIGQCLTTQAQHRATAVKTKAYVEDSSYMIPEQYAEPKHQTAKASINKCLRR